MVESPVGEDLVRPDRVEFFDAVEDENAYLLQLSRLSLAVGADLTLSRLLLHTQFDPPSKRPSGAQEGDTQRRRDR